jgi:hypothetical protein
MTPRDVPIVGRNPPPPACLLRVAKNIAVSPAVVTAQPTAPGCGEASASGHATEKSPNITETRADVRAESARREIDGVGVSTTELFQYPGRDQSLGQSLTTHSPSP